MGAKMIRNSKFTSICQTSIESLIFGILGLLVFSCANDSSNSSKNSNSNGEPLYQYHFTENGCSTEQQRANSKKEFCEILQDEELNKGCAPNLRKYRFEQEKCEGTWLRKNKKIGVPDPDQETKPVANGDCKIAFKDEKDSQQIDSFKTALNGRWLSNLPGFTKYSESKYSKSGIEYQKSTNVFDFVLYLYSSLSNEDFLPNEVVKHEVNLQGVNIPSKKEYRLSTEISEGKYHGFRFFEIYYDSSDSCFTFLVKVGPNELIKVGGNYRYQKGGNRKDPNEILNDTEMSWSTYKKFPW